MGLKDAVDQLFFEMRYVLHFYEMWRQFQFNLICVLMTRGGQPMDKSWFHSSWRDLVRLSSLEWRKAWWAWVGNPKKKPGIMYTREPAPLTVLPRVSWDNYRGIRSIQDAPHILVAPFYPNFAFRLWGLTESTGWIRSSRSRILSSLKQTRFSEHFDSSNPWRRRPLWFSLPCFD